MSLQINDKSKKCMDKWLASLGCMYKNLGVEIEVSPKHMIKMLKNDGICNIKPHINLSYLRLVDTNIRIQFVVNMCLCILPA